ncbi:hypothetical protein JJL56_18420 [Azospirillum sp. YIM DDC1]|uniref:Uncharacterized protein n=1 Tax=Azospirillum aestuarii TaxID=2802052 RepID=A0ABS1I2A1_9PROT|nr:hypothetical protein [Azospirillum aestuarii]MBK4720842.1 hypothetical protein [Azospirillum aestuarii]
MATRWRATGNCCSISTASDDARLIEPLAAAPRRQEALVRAMSPDQIRLRLTVSETPAGQRKGAAEFGALRGAGEIDHALPPGREEFRPCAPAAYDSRQVSTQPIRDRYPIGVRKPG